MFNIPMSRRILDRVSDIETPTRRVDVAVLKQKMHAQQKKEKIKKMIFFSLIFVSLSLLIFLTY